MAPDPSKVTREELHWREWILGRERYRDKGPRSKPRPNVGYGGPGQRKVPPEWWQRLEAFVARWDKKEHQRAGAVRPEPGDITPADTAQITEHFNVREFDCHDGRRVPAIAVDALDRLCTKYLEPMREAFGPCDVMSGYRPEDYNRRIGGAPLSQHIYELTPEEVAGDLTFARGRPRDWAAKAVALGAGGVGLYPGFVHVDNRRATARW